MLIHPSILILDSGIGGLSIAHDIRSLIKNINIIYVADTQAHPYGQKTEDEVTQRVLSIMEHTIPSYKPDLVVIACNTASTLVLTQARKIFSTPIIGVVPAIKPAALISETGVIGVLATEGTINRNYTNNLIQTFAKNKEILLYGSPALVSIAEKKLKGEHVNEHELKSDMENLVNQSYKMDTVVLACTHFPIIKEELQRNFPQIKHWVDSGEAIANRVLQLLPKKTSEANSSFQKSNRQQNKYNLFIGTTPSLCQYQGRTITPYLGPHQIESITIE